MGIKVSEPGHLSALDCLDYLGDNYSKRFSFACARNPYERFLSACVFNGHKDFEEVSNILVAKGHENIRRPSHFRTQKSMVTNLKGELIVDYVGRFEDFDKYVKDLSEKGLDVTSIHEYREPSSSDWEQRLTEKTKENIRSFYEEDFEFFNYKL